MVLTVNAVRQKLIKIISRSFRSSMYNSDQVNINLKMRTGLKQSTFITYSYIKLKQSGTG
jgi:hypothetical protein